MELKLEEINNYLTLNYHKSDTLSDNLFIFNFSLFYYDKLITMNTEFNILFSKFINYLRKKYLIVMVR